MIDQIHFFRTSLKKDLRYVFSPMFKILFVLLLLLIFGLSIGLFTALYSVQTPVREYDPGEDTHQYDFATDPLEEEDNGGYDSHWGEEGETVNFIWGEEREVLIGSSTAVAWTYGVAFILTIEFFLLIFHGSVFTQDQVKGAVRTWFHYPVSVKGYVLSKTFNILFFTVLLSLGLCGLSMLAAPTMGQSRIEMIGIVFVTMAVLFLNYLAYFAIFSILSKLGLRGRLTDPAALFLAGNAFLILMTQTGISGIYMAICDFQNWTYQEPFLTALKYLSPFHFLGAFYDWSYYGDPMSVLDLLWVVPTLIVIVVGFTYLKDLYPDMFIRETA